MRRPRIVGAAARWATRAKSARALPGKTRRTSARHRRASGNSTANGFASRCLRARNVRMASSLPASAINRKPPRPFTATMAPLVNRGDRSLQRVVLARELRAGGVPQRERWPAGRTRVWLRVKPAIERILVLLAARSAHRECLHRRPLAIVRQVLDDAEARAAVRAVDERIPKAPIAGVEQLAETVGARSRDPGARTPKAPRARRWRGSRSARSRWDRAPRIRG